VTTTFNHISLQARI